MKEFIDFLVEHRLEILEQTQEHMYLTLVALGFSCLAGISTGIVISRSKRISGPVMAFVNALQTIPSLALLGFMIPLLGIGAVPAIVALFLYGLLPIVRNTFVGIDGLDPSVREAAVGMGLTPYQILTKVELPLALPVIFAGIRTAFVINVGVATLAALIAAGGLGEFIFRGIALNNVYMILAGAIPAAVLAMFFDGLLGIIQKHVLAIFKPLLLGIALIAALTIGWKILTLSKTPTMRAGFPSEFIERGDGWTGLKKAYDMDMETVELEIGLMYRALRNKKVDVISGFSTDGRIKAYHLRSLIDNKQYFPPYYAAPLIREETLQRFPALDSVFSMLHNEISNEEMVQMNYRVDQDKISPKESALEFMDKKGFRHMVLEKEGDTDMVIGSKNFTENFILAELFKLMIENYSDLKVELRMGFGGTKLVFDALTSGEIDMYPEYTGTGFLVILNLPDSIKTSIQYKEQVVYDFVKKEFALKYNLTWLYPLGFNNTFAMMMREDDAEAKGIRSVSDLKEWLEKNR